MSSSLRTSFLPYMLRSPERAERRSRERPARCPSIMSRDGFEHLRVAERLDQLCSSERNRKCSDITPACGDIVAVLADDDDAEIEVAGLHELQDLRFLPELRAGILVDQHRALAQLLELVAKRCRRRCCSR